ncbi:hypothetical protein NON20_12865 [Synechocystis sp. B12]|nr:hypothetical protein NON20_12865 [Synechocystis sp. B12]
MVAPVQMPQVKFPRWRSPNATGSKPPRGIPWSRPSSRLLA